MLASYEFTVSHPLLYRSLKNSVISDSLTWLLSFLSFFGSIMMHYRFESIEQIKVYIFHDFNKESDNIFLCS